MAHRRLVGFPFLLATLFASIVGGSTAVAQDQASDRVRAQLDRYLQNVGNDEGKAAVAALLRAIDGDYAAVFAVWRGFDRERQQRERECLGHLLQIPAIESAAAIVTGSRDRCETLQGGVIDHHDLLLHLADAEVLRVDPAIADDLRRGLVPILSGTHEDHWLAQQLANNLRAVDGPRVWLFAKVRRLTTEGGGGGPGRTIELREWISLPAGAAACVRELLRD